jgi:hypothetical protein
MMNVTTTLRSYLIAGTAIAGAGVMAISPVQPVGATANRVITADVALAAAVGNVVAAAEPEPCDVAFCDVPDPIEFYTAVWNNTVFGVTEVWNQFAAAPFPIAVNALTNLYISAQIAGESILGTLGSVGQALLTETPQYLVNSVQSLFSGNVSGAVNNLISAVVAPIIPLTLLPGPLALVLSNPVYNIANVVQALSTQEAITTAFVGLVGPLISTVGAIATAVQNVINTALAGQFEDALKWVVNAPGVIFDGLVNGGYGPVLYSFPNPLAPEFTLSFVSGGLLNPEKFFPIPGGTQITSPGLVSSFLQTRFTISGALCPSGPCTNPTPPFSSATTDPVQAVLPAATAVETEADAATVQTGEVAATGGDAEQAPAAVVDEPAAVEDSAPVVEAADEAESVSAPTPRRASRAAAASADAGGADEGSSPRRTARASAR